MDDIWPWTLGLPGNCRRINEARKVRIYTRICSECSAAYIYQACIALRIGSFTLLVYLAVVETVGTMPRRNVMPQSAETFTTAYERLRYQIKKCRRCFTPERFEHSAYPLVSFVDKTSFLIFLYLMIGTFTFFQVIPMDYIAATVCL